MLCHGVLMYLDDLGPLLAALSAVVTADGLLSVLVRNGLAPAMREGLRGDWAAARAAFDSPRYVKASAFPRALTPRQTSMPPSHHSAGAASAGSASASSPITVTSPRRPATSSSSCSPPSTRLEPETRTAAWQRCFTSPTDSAVERTVSPRGEAQPSAMSAPARSTERGDACRPSHRRQLPAAMISVLFAHRPGA